MSKLTNFVIRLLQSVLLAEMIILSWVVVQLLGEIYLYGPDSYLLRIAGVVIVFAGLILWGLISDSIDKMDKTYGL